MKLHSIRVTNYKCIDDSEEFTLDQSTCLVGKNESGKTTILQALYKLNPITVDEGNFDALKEYPRKKWTEYKEQHKQAPAVVVTTTWRLAADEINELSKMLYTSISPDTNFVLTKNYANECRWEFAIDESAVVQGFLKDRYLNNEQKDTFAACKSVEELYRELCEDSTDKTESDQMKKEFEALFPSGNFREALNVFLNQRLPKLLYFSEYGKLQGRVSIDALVKAKTEKKLKESDNVFFALLDLAGTTLEEVKNIQESERLVAELEAVSNSLTDQIFEYWSQNQDLEVKFDYKTGLPNDPAPFNSGGVFHTRINNRRHGVSVSFDERSSGFVWFFSFLVWFSQVKKNYGENLIVLLDEPGLSLHAKAQSDLLRYFKEKLEPSHQLVYTTHSPFMVDSNHLTSCRTVEDVVDEQASRKDKYLGTKVGDRVLSKDADTLFPLQAALGYEITQSLFIGKNTLLVEGPSDLLYLTAISNELKARGRSGLDSSWAICPTGGIDKVQAFMSLFGGNKLNLAVLTDIAGKTKQKIEDVKRLKILEENRIFTAGQYIGMQEADIEDVIGAENFIALVNKAYSIDTSKLIKSSNGYKGGTRIMPFVEEQHRLLGSNYQDFDHYYPSRWLMENPKQAFTSLPDADALLERFERFFNDLNALLSHSTGLSSQIERRVNIERETVAPNLMQKLNGGTDKRIT